MIKPEILCNSILKIFLFLYETFYESLNFFFFLNPEADKRKSSDGMIRLNGNRNGIRFLSDISRLGGEL